MVVVAMIFIFCGEMGQAVAMLILGGMSEEALVMAIVHLSIFCSGPESSA
jgi:hypothetical protein